MTSKPLVYFVVDKWVEGLPDKHVPLAESFDLLRPLESLDAFRVKVFYIEGNDSCGKLLQEACEAEKPLLVYCVQRQSHYTPRWDIFHHIRDDLKIPVVMHWPDGVPDKKMPDILESATLSVIVQDFAIPCFQGHEDRYIYLWSPVDSRLFYDPQAERGLDCSFFGGRQLNPERTEGTETLTRLFPRTSRFGGGVTECIPLAEYLTILQTSKIVVNFALTKPTDDSAWVAGYKARIHETTFCGAMLLSSGEAATSRYFEPLKEYVPFHGVADLEAKVRYYLAHDAERDAIAKAGRERSEKDWTAHAYWDAILRRIFKNE